MRLIRLRDTACLKLRFGTLMITLTTGGPSQAAGSQMSLSGCLNRDLPSRNSLSISVALHKRSFFLNVCIATAIACMMAVGKAPGNRSFCLLRFVVGC